MQNIIEEVNEQWGNKSKELMYWDVLEIDEQQ